jgi:hypothetical protein
VIARAVVVAFVAAAVTASCSPASTTDAGAADAATDATLPCGGPVDVSDYVPEQMTPPHPPHLGKCSPTQVEDYAECQGAKVTSLCGQFAPGQPGYDCGTCVESQKYAPDGGPAESWGVVVFNGSSAAFNVEGCVDDALGQVATEKANGGPGSCGDALHASYGCQDVACASCTDSVVDFDQCTSLSQRPGDDASAPGGCKPYDDAVQEAGPCASVTGDAVPADVQACFPDASLSDPAREVDWLKRIVQYMCGS